ncbi:TonB-dependent receptor [Sphingobium lignivorans]|uniref:TonB-dependent receptor n=1 Tax=Sphingobium lignivorans TaxID=2735886 RepID=A0ABR6NEU6_9SPHN|nr:TonB-dependent receptor [Sphingobium lignivorans]MBB5985803.1 hypothetical protein [Sphingobium lignivorans]
MNHSFRFSAMILATASFGALAGAEASAQTLDEKETEQTDGTMLPPVGAGTSGEFGDEEEIVVTGARERGAVVGDTKPEQQFHAADIRALGVSTISDLLTELGPQLQSASGKPPVTLLEGRRIASFREIASLPAEAIARVDILPEEVGLRYGYSADQKVMNIVLRQRFRAFTGEAGTRLPTAGGAATLEAEGGFLAIRNGQRVNISAEWTQTNGLLESDRGLTRPESPARSLVPQRDQLTINGSYYRPLSERTHATLSAEIGTTGSESDVGLALPGVTIPGGTLYAGGPEDSIVYPTGPGIGALGRSSSTQNGEIGLTINAQRSSGQWTLTANYARQESRGITARPFDLTAYAQAVAAGDPTADPLLPLAGNWLVGRPADETRSTRDTANVDLLYNRSLFRLPAGDVAATARVSGSTLRIDNSLDRDLVLTRRNLARDAASGALTLEIPLTSASSPIGRLSANASGGVEHLSDAGTLRELGLGLNWTPRRGIAFSASYRDEKTAPTPAQLGDPVTFTQFVPVFDYVRGETALVTTISGGNAGLDAPRARNFRLGVVVTALDDPNLRLSLDYSRRRTDAGITGFPGITAETAAAFPDRFMRDGEGRLTQVDLRPINIREEKRDSIRWGINFSKRLRTPQSQIDAMRAAFQRRGAQGGQGGAGRQPGQDAPAPGGEGERPPAEGASGQGMRADRGPGGAGAGGGPRAGGGGRFGGGAGGPGGGGRLSFALYHEIQLTNTTQLATGLPVLDLLDGAALGSGAGPSRHTVEAQAGLSRSGYGLRLTGEWKSATHIDGMVGVPSSQLRFGDLATVNVRLFANLTQMPGLVTKVPLLRGVRVQIGVDNLFNNRQRVTDGNGYTPFAYQPAFVDPLGRTIRLNIRKLFF